MKEQVEWKQSVDVSQKIYITGTKTGNCHFSLSLLFFFPFSLLSLWCHCQFHSWATSDNESERETKREEQDAEQNVHNLMFSWKIFQHIFSRKKDMRSNSRTRRHLFLCLVWQEKTVTGQGKKLRDKRTFDCFDYKNERSEVDVSVTLHSSLFCVLFLLFPPQCQARTQRLCRERCSFISWFWWQESEEGVRGGIKMTPLNI